MSNTLVSTAMVAALSEKLLKRPQVDRMLGAENAEEAFRILNDFGWAAAVHESRSNLFEDVITKGLLDMKEVVRQVVDEDMQQILFLPFDLQNAKASLAAFLKGKAYDEIRDTLSDLSYFPRRTSYDLLMGKSTGGHFFGEAVRRAKEIAEGKMERIELAADLLDGLFWKEMTQIAESTKNANIIAYMQTMLLMENVKTVLRKKEGYVRVLDPKKSDGYAYEQREKILQQLKTGLFGESIQKAEKGDALADLEVEMELTALSSLYWPARSNPLGAENILLFFAQLLKNGEIIRTILVGKRNHLPNELLHREVALYFPFLQS